ncbi:MAG: DUF1398 domain-containing protein [Dongiaceae bacterium]
MDAQQSRIARDCHEAGRRGGLAFPEAVARLAAAGFEGYAVDFRRNTTTYYAPQGDSVVLDDPGAGGAVAAAFDQPAIAAAVREAQANRPGYSYQGFCAKVKGAGCAGYLVSFPGRRVVYFGRTAETHVEHFPD